MAKPIFTSKNDLSWMIGGAQGSGVDSSANVFARACTFGGLFVYGKREYYSNIMGEHSYFQVRISSRPVRSHVDIINLLATFDAETIVRHALEVTPDGGIVYDSSLEGTKISEIPTFERRFQDDLLDFLKEQGHEPTVDGVLEAARRNGVHLYPVPYNDILTTVAGKFGEHKLSKIARMVNIMAISASFSLLHYDFEHLTKAIRTVFRAKARLAEMNIMGAQMADDFVKQKYGEGFPFRLEKVPANEKRLYIQGSQAVALGKILGGCRFQTYYPITPASDESVYMEDHEIVDLNTSMFAENPQIEEVKRLDGEAGVVVVQTEDEISAITMAIGAALAGARASTSTSGPGFSLMAEGMGWAGMNEVPVVITLYQRAGPSTGLPTRHEQGDLKFALNAGHGDFPRIVLTSGDLEECFYDGIRAFNYADRYQLPVVHIVDKALANSNATFKLFDTESLKIDRGLIPSDAEINGNGEEYKRFKYTESGISPRIVLGTTGGIFWNTGDEHDEFGHITEDPLTRMNMMEKRLRKLETADKEIPTKDKLNFFGPEDADLTIVSWGSNKGAILDAIDLLNDEDFKLNFLHLRLMNPFPTKSVSEILGRAKRKVNVEMNYSSQLAGVIREKTGIAMDNYIVKYNGRPMSQNEVYSALKKVVLVDAPKRLVLSYGA